MRFLVVGSGSGLGSALVEELARRGHALTLLAEDPRRVPEDWKLRFRCHYGRLTNGHVLHEALEGADRIVLALSHPPRQGAADQEPLQVKLLLEANRAEVKCPVLKLTSWGSLFESGWWAMTARKKADQLVRQDPYGHLFAVGWLGESILHLRHRELFWIPAGLDGKILWISRHEAVMRLCDLSTLPLPPRHETVVGRIRMSLHEAVAHVVSRSDAGRHGLLRIPLTPLLRKTAHILPQPLLDGERFLWGCQSDDPTPPPSGEWSSAQDPFLEVLRRLDP